MAESRLTRRSLKQSKKQLYGSLITLVIIIFIALNFGPTLIGISGNIIDTVTGKSGQAQEIVSDADIQPPVIDALPEAISENSVNVTGRSYYLKGEVEIYVNGSRYKTIEHTTQDFEIKNVRLSEGENKIKARQVSNGKKSEFSDEEEISYLKDAPELEVSTPADRASFSKADSEIRVEGKTDPENTVRVNDFIAIVDSEGAFSHVVKLSEGDNKINIKATNPAGNSTTKEVTVSYSP